MLKKQESIEKALREAPDLSTFVDAVSRDKEVERQQQLQRQLKLLLAGKLLVAPGITFGRLADLDARIVEETERRDRAQHTLDAHLKSAETLLSVAAT